MALESFYGGKPGVSPVIKARFKYINTNDAAYTTAIANGKTADKLKPFTMSECFADLSYKDVWYDELCIIDTDNKFNPNNGKIYRRTLEPNNGLHAEYLGQIVGPSGGAAKISIGSINNAKTEAVKKFNKEDQYVYIDSSTQEQTTKSPGPADEHGNGNANAIATLTTSTTGNNITMVPGKESSDNTYHDQIRYTWCNVRRNENNSLEDVWLYLGFEIPYTSWDVQTQIINYWDNRTSLVEDDFFDKDENGNFKTDEDGNYIPKHPFYHNLTFYIPRGTRGIGPEEISLVGKENGKQLNIDNEEDEEEEYTPLYSFDVIDYTNDVYSIKPSNGTQYYENTQPSFENNDPLKPKAWKQLSSKTYWVAKYILYNPKLGSVNNIPKYYNDSVYIYLGDYKDVKSVNLKPDGTLDFNWSSGEISTLGQKIKWIQNITTDFQRKETIIKENGEEEEKDHSGYGNMTIQYNTLKEKNQSETEDQSETEGQFETEENQYETYTVKIPLIKDIKLNIDRNSSNFGQFTIENNQEKNPVFLSETIPFVEKMLYYNTDTTLEDGITTRKEGTISVKYAGEQKDDPLTQLKYVKGISYNTNTSSEDENTTKEGTISVQYTGEASPTELTQLKYVKGISYNTNTDTLEDGTTKEGTISVQYTGKVKPTELTQLKYVKDIEYDDTTGSTNGTISAQYTGKANPTTLTQLKYVKNISINSDTQQLSYTNNIGTSTTLAAILNIAKEFCIDERGHLLAYYNSSEYRPNINVNIATYNSKDNLYCYAQNNPQNHFSKTQNWVYPIDTSKQKVKIAGWWHDLGEVYNQSGIHIVTEYVWSFEDIDPNYDPPCTVDNILKLFNGTLKKVETDEEAIESPYPNGEIKSSQTNIDLTGGIVCVKEMENPNGTTALVTGLFSYNYEKGKWFYLGNWEDVGGQESASVRIMPYSWEQDNVLPLSTDVNPIITFVTEEATDNVKDIAEVLGVLPWENFSE